MTPLVNLSRAVIFVVVFFLLNYFVYYGFSWLVFKSFVFIIQWKTNMNWFWFWTLMVALVLPAVSIIWYSLKLFTVILVRYTARICTYKKFAYYVGEIMVFSQSGWILYRFWFDNHWADVSLIFLGVVFTILLFSLNFSFINTLRKSLENKKIEL